MEMKKVHNFVECVAAVASAGENVNTPQRSDVPSLKYFYLLKDICVVIFYVEGGS